MDFDIIVVANQHAFKGVLLNYRSRVVAKGLLNWAKTIFGGKPFCRVLYCKTGEFFGGEHLI